MSETFDQVHEKLYPHAAGKSEYVICAAIWYKDGLKHEHQPKNVDSGYVLGGRRHHNIVAVHATLTGKPTRRETSVQGFLTSKDRFLNREDAMKLAIECGQVPNDETNVGYELISEDLY